jgi:hypothetical protein
MESIEAESERLDKFFVKFFKLTKKWKNLEYEELQYLVSEIISEAEDMIYISHRRNIR